MYSYDRMSQPVGEVSAVGAVNAADLSTEFQPSTPEFDFSPEAIAREESDALAALARTPVASASISATPVAAASRAVSRANALHRATPVGNSSSVLRLRRGLGPRIPPMPASSASSLNLAASASTQRGLFSSSSAPNNQNSRRSPRKNTSANRNRKGGSRKKRTQRKKTRRS